MRYLVGSGKIKGASGGLSKLTAEEALVVVRQLRKHGVRQIHIYDAKRNMAVTEAELEHLAGGQAQHLPSHPSPAFHDKPVPPPNRLRPARA